MLAVWPTRAELSGDAEGATSARCRGAPPVPFDGRARWTGAAVIVDALLGTGFAGAPREPGGGRDRGDQRDAAPRWWRPTSRSGVDASTGEVEGAAVRAAATATFHSAKPGLWIVSGQAPRRARCG